MAGPETSLVVTMLADAVTAFMACVMFLARPNWYIENGTDQYPTSKPSLDLFLIYQVPMVPFLSIAKQCFMLVQHGARTRPDGGGLFGLWSALSRHHSSNLHRFRRGRLVPVLDWVHVVLWVLRTARVRSRSTATMRLLCQLTSHCPVHHARDLCRAS